MLKEWLVMEVCEFLIYKTGFYGLQHVAWLRVCEKIIKTGISLIKTFLTLKNGM